MLPSVATPTPAAQCFRDAEAALGPAVDALRSTLDACGGMAGSDSPGWAGPYDELARATALSLAAITTGCARMGPMLEETWALYGTADRHAFRAYAQAMLPGVGSVLPPPVELPAPPSAGGSGGGGGPRVAFWLHPVVTLLGHWVHWPSCDIDRLQATGDAWHALADAAALARIAARDGCGALESFRAPGLGSATRIGEAVAEQLGSIGQASQALAEACFDYADAASELESQLTERIKQLVEAVGLVALIGLLTSLATAGGGGAAAGDAATGLVSAWIADTVALIGSTEAKLAVAAGCLAGVPLLVHAAPDFSGVRLPGVDAHDQIAAMASEPGLGAGEPGPGAQAPPPAPKGIEVGDEVDETTMRGWERGSKNPPHTFARHVDVSLQDILRRAAQKAAFISKYRDSATCIDSINQVLSHSQKEITAWLARPGSGPLGLRMDIGTDIGVGSDQLGHVTQLTRVFVLLRRTGTSSRFIIQTSFPTL